MTETPGNNPPLKKTHPLPLREMADIEHVGERVPLIQAQGRGLGPPDHQRAQLPPKCPFRRSVINRPHHVRARALQAMQASLEVPADDCGRRLFSRVGNHIAHHRHDRVRGLRDLIGMARA